MIPKFNRFEKTVDLLEKYSLEELEQDSSILEGIDIASVEKINNSLVKDINEGILDNVLNWIGKKIPGTVLKKADGILKNYEQVKMETLSKVGKERTKAFKARVESEKDPVNSLKKAKYEEIQDRVDDAIEAIKDADRSKLKSIEDQLGILARGKSARVKDYIDLKLAEIKEKIAGKKLKDAQSYASEEEIKKLEKAIEDAGKEKKQKAAKLKSSVESNDPQTGEIWNRVSKEGKDQKVKILGDKFDEKKEIQVVLLDDKGKETGTKFLSKRDSLKSKVESEAKEIPIDKETKKAA